MKNRSIKIGFLQALGLSIYVTLFASVIQFFSGQKLSPNPFVSITTFLLAFITSAFICGSIALICPFKLFMENKKAEAFQIVLWNIIFLVIFFGTFLICNFIL